jgi:hypothetical protein
MNTTVASALEQDYSVLKKLIWLYFFLWFFEGALRKWVLPGLATPLLIVRDPVAIYILYRAFKERINFVNTYITIATICTFLSIILTLMIGHANLFVAIFGARIMLLHFPLIFVIEKVLKKEDLLKMGFAILALTPLLTIILAIQFYSPQTAWINVGIGGEGSSGFSGAMDYFRPSGTFSFITGPSTFLPLSCVFIIYFWLNREYCSKTLLYIATISLFIATPLTISRTCVFSIVLVLIFGIIGSLGNKKNTVRLFQTIIVLTAVLLVLKNTPIFATGVEVFSSRLDSATAAEASEGGGVSEGIYKRVILGGLAPIINILIQPVFAGNLGMGTNAGAQLLQGNTGYLIAEDEIGRIVGESGIVIGLLLLAIRFKLSISLFFKSFAKAKQGEILPWLLYSVSGYIIIQGSLGQPTQLGFMVFVTGFLLASLKEELI